MNKKFEPINASPEDIRYLQNIRGRQVSFEDAGGDPIVDISELQEGEYGVVHLSSGGKLLYTPEDHELPAMMNVSVNPYMPKSTYINVMKESFVCSLPWLGRVTHIGW